MDDNVALLRRTIDHFNRMEIDAALELVTDDFEIDWSNSKGLLRGVYKGRDEARGFWRSFLEAWDEVRWDPQEIIAVDESRVVLVNRVLMRGGSSGIDVDATSAQVWTFAGGRVLATKLYQSKAEALEAAQPRRNEKPPS